IISDAEKHEQFDNIYSLKIGLIHKITSTCHAIMANLKDDAFNLTNADKKKIRIDVKNNLNWLKNKDLDDLEANELEKRENRLSKMYSPLIANINKKNTMYKDSNIVSNAAEIYNDDSGNEN